ncbi:glutamate--tRNA ligase family protein [Candidatus Vidania fulgoroideorum]
MKNFIIKIIKEDKKKHPNVKIVTRFAPEPSGYLHIGHIKCFYINYHISKKFKGYFFLKIDDSNPRKIKNNYTKNIFKIFSILKKKILICFSSLYFKKAYNFSKIFLIKNISYIDSQTFKKYNYNKGNYKKKGKISIFIKRKKIEFFYLLKKMREGKYKNKEHYMRLKINMINKNILLRDPVIYRIIKKNHIYKNFNIYPSYDFINSFTDYYDKVTHSICTLEFYNNRTLYNYYMHLYNKIKKKNFFSKQIEFSKLNINGIKLSKREIKKNMKKKKIKKCNDKRLLTVSGLLNRGFDMESLFKFVINTGYTKKNSSVNLFLLNKIFINKKKNLKKIKIIRNPIKIKFIIKFKYKTYFIEKCDFINHKKKIILLNNYFFFNIKNNYFSFIGKNFIFYNYVINLKKIKKILLKFIKSDKLYTYYINKYKVYDINKFYILEKLGIFKLIKEKNNIIFSEVLLFKNAKNKPGSV